MVVSRLYAGLKVVTAITCAYEAFAIATRRVPTVSMYCGRRRWLAPLIIGALTVHLYWPIRKAQS